jgi:hypothetical protein
MNGTVFLEFLLFTIAKSSLNCLFLIHYLVICIAHFTKLIIKKRSANRMEMK